MYHVFDITGSSGSLIKGAEDLPRLPRDIYPRI